MAGADHAPLTVLLVEDDDGDVALVEAFFEDHPQATRLRRVTDGVEALRYLRGHGPFAGEPMPDLVLLDLNMPRMDGHAFLSAVKADQATCSIPVIILSSSAAPQDVQDAYAHHANCFIRKPVAFDALCVIARRIDEFWNSTAVLPPTESL